MQNLKNIICLSIALMTMSHLTKHQKPMPTFAAKFYDPQGVFLGDFGTTDSTSPIYIASCEMLFPYKQQACDAPITPKDIVALVGTEIIDDRHTPIVELNLHVGLFKLPPKEHRDDIQKAIEQTHLDPQIPHKIDSIDYEIGGCGYHNNAGLLLHLRAKDGLPSSRNTYPSVEVFNAIDYETKVDSNQQLITDSGSKLIYERRVEYTWHTHPPKINARFFEQAPSRHDFNFGNNYPYIKQHFLISLKYKVVYYYGFGAHLTDGNTTGDMGVYNIKMDYGLFFALK